MCADPKTAKNTVKLFLRFFALLGYAHLKVAQKMLVKLTQGSVLLIIFHKF